MGSVKRYLQAASVGTLNRRKRAGTVGLLTDTPPKQAAVEEERRSRRISSGNISVCPRGVFFVMLLRNLPERQKERAACMQHANLA